MTKRTIGDTAYRDGSVFTVTSAYCKRRFDVQPVRYSTSPNEPSFDLAVLQFDDSGAFVDPAQMDSVEECIRRARGSEQNRNGAIVMLFIHGWHHSAGWNRNPSVDAADPDGDTHFHAFRLLLEYLALREAERYPAELRAEAVLGAPGGGGRRVIGIYLAWNGDAETPWFSKVPGIASLSFLSFRNRYGVAKQIGESADVRSALRKIVARTKELVPVTADQPAVARPESPLVLIGHSMGALILESAFLATLEQRDQPLLYAQADHRVGPVGIQSHGVPVTFPDVFLALNSAAYTGISRRVLTVFTELKMSKQACDEDIKYSPPLFISATSEGDWATRSLWRMAHYFRFWRKTDGNDSTLFTHRLFKQQACANCPRLKTLDFGQNWHCIRPPVPRMAGTPSISVDLPVRDRTSNSLPMYDRASDPPQGATHDRYTLSPLGPTDATQLMWVFRIPVSVVPNHNDIFNSRARALVLSLIQISGAIASLAEDWRDTFLADPPN